ncbi:MAG TPA: murein biosynthesis integral membrane protein MurJ [Arthrobacter sp.]|nr:murein biosynthesis integral membrane protein MurJ [Arthrobacter sp.]
MTAQSTTSERKAPDAARSSAIMAAGTLVSRGLGFVKTILLSVALGAATGVADIFDIANQIPNIIYLAVAGGVFNAVLVPQIIKASKQHDRGTDYVSRLLTLMVLVMALLALVITLSAGWIIPLLTTNFSPAQLTLTTVFALWCLPQIFFYGLYAVLGQILNSYGSFGPYMWAPVLNNVVAIGGLLLFIVLMGSQQMQNGHAAAHTVENWSTFQTILVAGTATLGIAVQAVVLAWPVKRLGLGLRPRFGWRGIGLGRAAKIAIWTLGTMVVGNGAFLIFTKIGTIATSARDTVEGAVAGPYSLTVATQVYLLPHSIVVLSVATVLFNRMSHAASSKDDDAMRHILSRGLRTVGVATVFGAVALLVLAGPLGMLFSGGRAPAGALVGIVLSFLALGLPFFSANFMMNRVFYSFEDARTPFIIQIILTTIGITLAVGAAFFPPQWVIFALAASYTLGSMSGVVVSHQFLKRRLGNYDGGRIIDSHIRMTCAALGAGAAGVLVLWLFGGYDPDGFAWGAGVGRYVSILSAIAVLAVAGTVMGLVYLLLLKLFRVHELKEFLEPLLERVGRGRR